MVSVVSPLVWVITVVVLLAIIVLDLTVIARRHRTVTTKDAVRWVLVYIGLAAVFAAGLFIFLPGAPALMLVRRHIQAQPRFPVLSVCCPPGLRSVPCA